MLNLDDFFENQERQLALAIKRQEAFITEVEAEITNQAFTFFAEYLDEKETITKRLQAELHDHVLMLNDAIDYLLAYENKNEPINQSEFRIRPKHKFETAQEELEFELNRSTGPHRKEFIDEMKECINEDRLKREFHFTIYNQIMKTAFNHFPEIIELNGNSIRKINHTAYTTAIIYTEGFYYLICEW